MKEIQESWGFLLNLAWIVSKIPAFPGGDIPKSAAIFRLKPGFDFFQIDWSLERMIPKDRILPDSNFCTVSRNPRELRSEIREGPFVERENRGSFLHFCRLLETSLLVSSKVFFLNNLLASRSFPSDHVPENFSTHGKVLGSHISDLEAPLHLWIRDLVPAH